MNKSNSPAQFVVTVPDEGSFTFIRRSMRQQVAIECEYARLTEGVAVVTDFLGKLSTAMADLKVLTVEAPKGWDVDELDGWDESDYARLMRVWSALRDKEAAFRRPATDEGERQGDGGNDGAVVPPPIPTVAD